MLKEFTELKVKSESQESVLLLDAGCGVGNALFPLSKQLPNLKVDAFDFAKKAVELIRNNEKFDPESKDYDSLFYLRQ